MNVREYCQTDYQAILGIYAHSKLDELRYENTAFDLVPLEQDEKRRLGLFESDIYVYEENGMVLGYGAVLGSEIRALFVRPSSRGRGVGSSLLEYLLAKSPATVCLNVVKSNTPAIRLYSQYGFKAASEFWCDYSGSQVVVIKMERAG